MTEINVTKIEIEIFKMKKKNQIDSKFNQSETLIESIFKKTEKNAL